MNAKLIEFAAEKTAAAADATKPSDKLGITVRPITGDEQKQLATNGGLVVEDVAGPAARAGIAPGDVIIAVNNEQVKDADQLRRVVENQKSGSVAVLVQRDGRRIYIPVKLG